MNSLIFALVILGTSCQKIYSNAIPTVNSPSSSNSEMAPTSDKNDTQIPETGTLWKKILLPLGESLKIGDSKKPSITNIDGDKRKSRILGSLAFLAGLGVGGLATAASSTVKTYSKLPAALTFNLGSSRFSPYIAAIYDPYPYAPHPYVYAGPLGLYPLLNPTRLQSAAGNGANGQNSLEPETQNQLGPQLFNIFDNKGQTDLLDNTDEYSEEEKRVENEKTSSNVEEETDDRVELRLEADRNAEEKMVNRAVTCGTPKVLHKKQSNAPKTLVEEEDLQQDADDSLTTLSFRQANVTQTTTTDKVTRHHHRHRTTRKPQQTNATTTTMETTTPYPLTTVTANTTENSTSNISPTGYPPFFGYYGGNPQEVDHVDFTTETSPYAYHDYGHINYNLPYDRPANFYPDEKYNYYSNPPPNSYPSNQYQQDQVPEFYNNDFNRLLYTPDNPAPFVNGFRPVL